MAGGFRISSVFGMGELFNSMRANVMRMHAPSSWAKPAFSASISGWLSISTTNTSIREREKIISLSAWIVIGFVAGFVSTKINNRGRKGALIETLVGTIGGVIGGWLYYTLGPPSITGLNLSSLVVAFANSLIFLMVYQILRRL